MVGERQDIAFVALALVSGTGRQWTERDSLRLAGVIGGFIVAVLVLGIVILTVRKRLFAREHELSSARSLMEQVRAMHDRGEMSEEEYEATRRALASKVAANVKRDAGVAAPDSFAKRSPRASNGHLRAAPGAQVARPGFDLTGEPLPGRQRPSPPHGGAPPPPPGYADGAA
jgi:uncharacterized membrane protein